MRTFQNELMNACILERTVCEQWASPCDGHASVAEWQTLADFGQKLSARPGNRRCRTAQIRCLALASHDAHRNRRETELENSPMTYYTLCGKSTTPNRRWVCCTKLSFTYRASGNRQSKTFGSMGFRVGTMRTALKSVLASPAPAFK